MSMEAGKASQSGPSPVPSEDAPTSLENPFPTGTRLYVELGNDATDEVFERDSPSGQMGVQQLRAPTPSAVADVQMRKCNPLATGIRMPVVGDYLVPILGFQRVVIGQRGDFPPVAGSACDLEGLNERQAVQARVGCHESDRFRERQGLWNIRLIT
jgi:hypothetical protein